METRKKQVNPNRIFSGMQQRRSDECLVVEDSTPGVMAGIAAGGETIYIHDMVDVPEEVLEHASASLEDLGQIIEWMENVK